jgi:hypothetical protein
MIKVKPRPGIILPGIPRKGAEVEDKLAKEWLANKLVVLVEEKRKRGRPKGSGRKVKPPETPPAPPAKEE